MSEDTTDRVLSGWEQTRPDLAVGALQVTARLSRIGPLLARRQEEVFDRFGLSRGEVGALLVVSGRELVGIVSERDYARKVILLGKSSKDTTVAAIMTPSPVTVTPAHTVDDCMRLVSEHRIRHLPVVESGEPVGMISIGDLVKAIISSQAFTIDQLHTYIGADYPS